MTTNDRDDDGAFRSSLRRAMLVRRAALDAATHAALSLAIRARLDATFPELATQVVGFCWPVQNEPDLVPFAEALISRGGRVALPVVVRPGAALAFREWWPGQPLVPDRYDIPTPTDGNFAAPQALLLPVNAFDAAGFRIGYGGGFFDRTLAALTPRPLTIGVGFAFQQIESTRPQAHDLALDAIVTEQGIVRPVQPHRPPG
jgi:5,10-methenyltetrahydrofolate synthetase